MVIVMMKITKIVIHTDKIKITPRYQRAQGRSIQCNAISAHNAMESLTSHP
jgi:hypothetical protein